MEFLDQVVAAIRGLGREAGVMAIAWGAAIVVTTRQGRPLAMTASFASVARPSSRRLRRQLLWLAAGSTFSALLAGAAIGLLNGLMPSPPSAPTGVRIVLMILFGLVMCGTYLLLAWDLCIDESGPDAASSAKLQNLAGRDPELDAVLGQWRADGCPVMNRAVRQFASLLVSRRVESALLSTPP